MSTTVLHEPEVLAQAAALPFAGSLARRDTWALMQAGRAVCADIRGAETCDEIAHLVSVVRRLARA